MLNIAIILALVGCASAVSLGPCKECDDDVDDVLGTVAGILKSSRQDPIVFKNESICEEIVIGGISSIYRAGKSCSAIRDDAVIFHQMLTVGFDKIKVECKLLPPKQLAGLSASLPDSLFTNGEATRTVVAEWTKPKVEIRTTLAPNDEIYDVTNVTFVGNTGVSFISTDFDVVIPILSAFALRGIKISIANADKALPSDVLALFICGG